MTYLEYKLAYYDVNIQHFTKYTMGTPFIKD